MKSAGRPSSNKPSKPPPPNLSRSADQQQASAVMPIVMQAWENLSDGDRRVWRQEAAHLRIRALTYFKKVNLRRLHRGEDLCRLPPSPQPRTAGLILQRLIVHNDRGRLRLELELQQLPAGPTSVWGARPCNRGREHPHHCPRLGWLEVGPNLRCDITRLYYAKHGPYLRFHAPNLPGKRIFICAREELDYGKPLFEEVHALIPPPNTPPTPKKPCIPA